MSLIDFILQNPDVLRQVGENALAHARAAGTAVYYMDDEHGDDIIREWPDGRRERLIRGQRGVGIPIEPRRA